jgi:hypothetical protein
MMLRNIWTSLGPGRINEIEKNEMGEACSTYGKKERCIQDFGGET